MAEGILYDTDVVMRNLWLHLVRDFRTVNGLEYASKAESAFTDRGIKGLRAIKWPARCQAPPYLHKQEAQLENLFKRYRFKDDVFSAEDLRVMSFDKFKATQERISQPLNLTPCTFLVLQRARRIAKAILGKYSEDEHIMLCRFGKRACATVPYSRSYLDMKMGSPITGSKDHVLWFMKTIAEDDILSSAIMCAQKTESIVYRTCDTLALSLVPKSYKAHRTVKPPTLIGSYYTYGLGKVIQARLLEIGLDIRRLQSKHRRIVKRNSRTRKLATADLSAASDSITRELLRWIVPSSWYRVIMHGYIPSYTFEGVTYGLQSVMTMGDGHTFPLQTLIFYSLLKAIAELVGIDGSDISVYGDDLIYPSGLHRYVRRIFPNLHLILNGDKTYVNDFFRESCGSDYYRGFDVRPFQFQGEHQLLNRQRFASFLYKLVNGLRLRWESEEIPKTLEYLEFQILNVSGSILQVPPSFPEGSGIRTEAPKSDIRFAPVKYHLTTFTWVFNYLHCLSGQRLVECQYPFYWERLRALSTKENEAAWSVYDRGDEPVLSWRKVKTQPRTVRATISGTRLRRLEPVVKHKIRSTIVEQQGSTSSWT